MTTLERFLASAERVGFEVHQVPDEQAAVSVVRDIVDGRACLVDDDVLGGATGQLDDLPRPEDPWDARVGISRARWAAAESATLALVQAPGSPRRTSILPVHHVVVLPSEALRENYQDVVDEVAALRPAPTGVQLVTGASRSGDIESAMIQGMHGPAKVFVVLLG